MSTYYKGVFFFLFALCSLAAFAQRTPALSGIVLDSLTRKGVELATVRVLRADSTLLTGANTRADGAYSVASLKPGSYLLAVSFVGYRTEYRRFEMPKNRSSIQLSPVLLAPASFMLKEASVVATVNPVQMEEDTIAFNADAFRVPEGSVLEELIKRLPGVELEDDGTLTVNGKQVSQFLVNGKNFFRGNKKTALKNLPADLVKKIKSYEKKSDYAEQTGIDDGEEETVMDIVLKKELNESWISNIDLAYGTDDLYAGRLFVNRMTDYSRQSGYVNMGNPNGTSRSESAGVDFTFSNRKNGREMREAGSYSLGGHFQIGRNRSNQRSGSNSETFLTSGTSRSFSNRLSHNVSRNEDMSGNFRFEWHSDTLTTFTMTPSFSYGKSEGHSSSRSATFNGDPYAITGLQDPLDAVFADDLSDSLRAITVNRNDNASRNDGDNRAVGTDLMWVRRLSAKGRNVNFRGNVNYNRSGNHSFNRSLINYYQPNVEEPFRLKDQYSLSPSQSWGYSVQAGYSEPLFKGFHLQFRYQYAYRYNNRDRSLYNLDSLSSWRFSDHELGMLPAADSLQTVLDRRNSQYATYDQYNHSLDWSLRYINKKLRLNAGVSFRPQKTRMSYEKGSLDTVVTRRLYKVSPSVNFQYRLSRTDRIEFRYRGSSSDPSMTQLLDVTDDSNPLHISKGNPGLKSSWTDRLSVGVNLYNVERQTGWNFDADYSRTSNSISTAVLYNEETGVQTTRPENINGNWNTNGSLSYHTVLGKKKRFRIHSTLSSSYQNSVGFIRTSGAQSSQKNTNRTLNMRERLRGSYRNDWLEVVLNGQVNYRHSQNRLNPSANLDTYHFSYGTDVQVRLPWRMTLNTDIGVRSRRGYDNPSMNTDELIWNIQLSQQFLKKNAATVRLDFHDILRERSNVNSTINAQRRSESWNETVYSYCMLHFIYRLNVFRGSKEKGEERTARRGPRPQRDRGGRP